MKHDIKRLDEKIKRLHKSFSTLTDMLTKPTGVPDWWTGYTHKPGWTTLVENMLFEAGIDSVSMHIEAATEHYKRLIEAAPLVGKSE